MRRRLTLPRTRVWEGPLVLVNPSHPIRQEGLLELVPADPCSVSYTHLVRFRPHFREHSSQLQIFWEMKDHADRL